MSTWTWATTEMLLLLQASFVCFREVSSKSLARTPSTPNNHKKKKEMKITTQALKVKKRLFGNETPLPKVRQACRDTIRHTLRSTERASKRASLERRYQMGERERSEKEIERKRERGKTVHSLSLTHSSLAHCLRPSSSPTADTWRFTNILTATFSQPPFMCCRKLLL